MGKILLTFDDGPKPISSLDTILSILEEHNIISDFYCTGAEMSASNTTREAVARIHNAGHKVENHAWSHKRLDTMPIDELRDEVSRTQDLITDLTGETPTKLRPPYGAGAFGSSKDAELVTVAEEYNLQLTLWDVDTRDWEKPVGLSSKISSILEQIERNKNKDIIDVLMHVLPNTADDLTLLIKAINDEGYEIQG